MKSERLADRNVVLLGIGHTNAHVVRMWKMQALPNTQLTCISDRSIATYSGMLPAVLAGQIPPEDMELDLVQLCNSVGASLIIDRVEGLDLDRQLVLFGERPPVPFDVLSVGIGSIPTIEDSLESGAVIKIKPMQTFLRRLEERLSALKVDDSRRDRVVVTIVGSGVAGIEVLCCLSPFLKKHGISNPKLRLVTRSQEVLPEVDGGVRRRVERVLAEREVEILVGKAVSQITSERITLDDGSSHASDLVIWATGASAPPTLSALGLPTDERGFLATDHTLRSSTKAPVFVVGDSGTIVGEALPKAGVYAVRQGPILWHNIARTLNDQPLVKYKPQRSFLKLINLGDDRAIGHWRGISFQGRWVYRLKHWIDSKFMEKHRPAPMVPDGTMQCRGCGCKLGASTLSAAIQAAPTSAQIRLEDAAEIGGRDSNLVASTDFFSNPFDDAYLAGRVAALHAASDIVATGAKPTDALANVVLPEGPASAQQRLLSDFLAGARKEFAAMDAEIVGGHTIVGPRMEAGFTVVGRQLGPQLLRKDGLQPDDELLMTKPLGIGVLLAAHMRSACRARDFEGLIDSMLAAQHEYARIAVELGLTACTDITGFGLAGHLLEMLEASHVVCEISLGNIPVLNGATAAVHNGIESSLIGDNLQSATKVEAAPELQSQPSYRLLFDPQTCGGLLFGVAAEKRREFETRLAELDLPGLFHIGTVRAGSCDRPLRVVP